jgi:hypothetical protein
VAKERKLTPVSMNDKPGLGTRPIAQSAVRATHVAQKKSHALKWAPARAVSVCSPPNVSGEMVGKMTNEAKGLREEFSNLLASMARLCARARREDSSLAARIEQALGVLIMRWPRYKPRGPVEESDTLSGLGPKTVNVERGFPDVEDTDASAQ